MARARSQLVASAPRTSIGVRLRQLREDAGLSQRELAELAGVHLSVVFKIEQGTNNNPRVWSLAALAEPLDVTLDELIGRRPRHPPEPVDPTPGRRGNRKRRA